MRKKMTRYLIATLSLALILASASCQQGSVSKPSDKKTQEAFNKFVQDAELQAVNATPVNGVFEVVVKDQDDRTGIVYMSGDAEYFFTGSLLKASTGEDLTTERMYDLTKVDYASIPLSNSLVLGPGDSRNKVFVFSDPSCLPCALYHEELKKVAREYENVSIYIKMFAIPNLYPKSFAKAKAIHCAETNDEAIKRLDALYAAEEVPYPDCSNKAVEDNMEIVSRLKISRSPTTVFPNGVKFTEAMRAEDFVKQLKKRGGTGIKERAQGEITLPGASAPAEDSASTEEKK